MKETGMLGEDLACSFLISQGYRILVRNFRVPMGEIDIVARDRDELVFVEVKTRSSKKFGYPEESVGFQKIKKIVRAMRAYLMKHPSQGTYRFDIISLEIHSNNSQKNIRHIRAVELDGFDI